MQMAQESRQLLESIHKSIQTENYGTTVYEVLLPVTDMPNHTAIQVKGTEKQIAIKGIHVRNGFKPYYLLPRERREIHLKLGLTMKKMVEQEQSLSRITRT